MTWRELVQKILETKTDLDKPVLLLMRGEGYSTVSGLYPTTTNRRFLPMNSLILYTSFVPSEVEAYLTWERQLREALKVKGVIPEIIDRIEFNKLYYVDQFTVEEAVKEVTKG